ncbi:GNAT family N-acetyltransferase [Chengkuizengella sp. 2205SS18-9]|uniref:GNAT family N-acetyltransferase n=2 Tax=Chengkuizengella axinellae TaxID=3064388 RepID=A0ABT9IUC3_9BACL|nr:GNAT family N-acetyltransferase [Chengkuizengella sp. 2205SS18-9]MDP5272902.1 GNAT family N-acetyltransferase [Chengkuizengella sp. 2205SS18-9]
MNQIKITQATIHDLEDVAQLFDQYRIFYEQKSDLEGAKQFLYERFEHQESVIFLAREQEEGAPAGFTQLYPIFSSVSMERVWLLNDLYVNEKFRGRGIAQGLLESAKSFAQKTNAKGIELATAKDNYSAQRIYEALGYEKDDFFHYFLSISS